MFQRSLLTLFALLLSFSSVAFSEREKPKGRPTIGLVLGGGGALGFAHVGVLKVLEKHRIPIDRITGTSMGAIVGAAYASGVSLDEMEKVLSETDWDGLFNESVPRRDVPYRFKPGRDRELFGDIKFGFYNGEFTIPSGVVSGQNVFPLLQKMYNRVPSPTHFDELPIPFRGVAADIENGGAYAPEKGDLATIVRASMSVPGFFSPVEMDGRLLVDGGIMNNLPVDIARDLGADIIIAVDLYVKLKNKDELSSPFSITGQMISLMMIQSVNVQKSHLTKKDIFIEPNLTGYTPLDFKDGQAIMDIGEEKAISLVETFDHLGVSESEYQQYQKRRSQPLSEDGRIDFIRVKNDSNVPVQRIRKTVGVEVGDTLDRDEVEEGLLDLYRTGWFSKTEYKYITEGDQKGIEINAKQKKWIDDFIRIGAAFEDDFNGDSNYRLAASFRQTGINNYGAYTDFDIEIGRNPNLYAELYQPFTDGSPYFIAPNAQIGRNNLLLRNGGDTIAEYHRTNGFLGLSLGSSLGNIGETMIGYRRGFGDLERDIGDPSLPEFGYDIADLYAILNIDALDSPDLPTDGFLTYLQFRNSVEEVGASDDFQQVYGRLTKPFTFGQNTITLSSLFGSSFGDLPPERTFTLGGFFNLSGFEQNGLVASDYVVGSAAFYRRFNEIHTPIGNIDFFAGGTFELAALKSSIEFIEDESLIVAGSTFIGVDTPLLPTYLGVGVNDEDEFAIYFAVGRIGARRQR